jgi:NAD(P)-dependent dehydrogenase (short-subunit alcohol dehydrogenase family)
MTIRFDDRVAIVTGAGGGLGRAYALALAARGAKVVVNDLGGARDGTGSSLSMAGAVVEEIRAAGGDAVANGASVTDERQVEAMVAETRERWGRVDILVNNAGVLRDKTFAKMTIDDFRFVLDVHLMGSAICTKAVWDLMREQAYGRIVMTTSSTGLYGNFGQANYGAAKAGIAAFSTIVAMEMARYNVTSNAIAPSALTRMTEALLPPDVREDRRASLERGEFDFFDPDNVGPFVAYLASDASSHISGKVFGVQGDSIELYQPFTSVAEVRGDGHRWDAENIPGRMDELFAEAGMDPAPENMMARSRHKIIS